MTLIGRAYLDGELAPKGAVVSAHDGDAELGLHR